MKFGPFGKPVVFFAPDSGGNAGDGGSEDPEKDKTKEEPKTVTMTQAEFDQKMGDRATRAAQSAVNALLKKLGVDTEDNLAKTFGEGKKALESQMSDLEKAQAQLTEANNKLQEAETEKQTALAAANERVMRSEVKAEAVRQGFRPEAIEDVWLVLDKGQIKEKDGTFTGIKEAVEKVGKDKPFWLAASNGAPPRGTPGAKPQARSNQGPAGQNPAGDNRPRVSL